MAAEPPLPTEIAAYELDREVRAGLRSLAKPVAETVARRLVAAGELLDVEPELSLGHALAARRQASRVATVREAVGLAAYRCGQWQLALSELRTYHRMTGRQTHLAILADCERGLGRPERAVDMLRATDRRSVDAADWVELLIVAAGARRDMGQDAAAVTMLQLPALDGTGTESWRARLRYAYADALEGVGRRDEARHWFARAAAIDPQGDTDAVDRLLDLDGVTLTGDPFEEDEARDELAEAGVEDDAAHGDVPDGGTADGASVPAVDNGDVDEDARDGAAEFDVEDGAGTDGGAGDSAGGADGQDRVGGGVAAGDPTSDRAGGDAEGDDAGDRTGRDAEDAVENDGDTGGVERGTAAGEPADGGPVAGDGAAGGHDDADRYAGAGAAGADGERGSGGTRDAVTGADRDAPHEDRDGRRA